MHSVGHSSRLNRHEKIGDHTFGSKEDYSQDYPNFNIIPIFGINFLVNSILTP